MRWEKLSGDGPNTECIGSGEEYRKEIASPSDSGIYVVSFKHPVFGAGQAYTPHVRVTVA
jgi:hypothetical protein